MTVSVVCNGNRWKDYLEVIAEFGSQVFSLKCQGGFVLISTAVRVLYCIVSVVLHQSVPVLHHVLVEHTYLLTPCSRVLLEKLTGFAANQIPRILWNPKVHYRTH